MENNSDLHLTFYGDPVFHFVSNCRKPILLFNHFLTIIRFWFWEVLLVTFLFSIDIIISLLRLNWKYVVDLLQLWTASSSRCLRSSSRYLCWKEFTDALLVISPCHLCTIRGHDSTCVLKLLHRSKARLSNFLSEFAVISCYRNTSWVSSHRPNWFDWWISQHDWACIRCINCDSVPSLTHNGAMPLIMEFMNEDGGDQTEKEMPKINYHKESLNVY